MHTRTIIFSRFFSHTKYFFSKREKKDICACFVSIVFFSFRNPIFHFYTSKELKNIKGIYMKLLKKYRLNQKDPDIYQNIQYYFFHLTISRCFNKISSFQYLQQYHCSPTIAYVIGRAHKPEKKSNLKTPRILLHHLQLLHIVTIS